MKLLDTLPVGWKWIEVGELCEAVRGVTFSSGEGSLEKSPGFVACLTTSGVQEEVAWESRRFIPRARVPQDKQMLRRGDLLVSTANSKEIVGKSCLVGNLPFPCTFGAFVTTLRPYKNVSPNLLAYWMRTPSVLRWCYEASSSTTNISNLRVSELLALELPMPPLPEQQRLATLLDKADHLRRTRRYAQQLSDTFLQSVFLEMFGDPATNLKGWDVVTIEKTLSKSRAGTQSGPFGSSLKRHEYVADGVPVWGINNVKPNEFIKDQPLHITTAKYQQLTTYSVEVGDILISRAGTTGRMCVARPIQLPSIIGTNLVRVSLDHAKMVPDYFTALFTYLPDRVGSLRTSDDENAYSFLNPSNLRLLRIPVPPVALQEQFAQVVRRTERLRGQQREAARQAEHLFQTLLVRAFRGEV